MLGLKSVKQCCVSLISVSYAFTPLAPHVKQVVQTGAVDNDMNLWAYGLIAQLICVIHLFPAHVGTAGDCRWRFFWALPANHRLDFHYLPLLIFLGVVSTNKACTCLFVNRLREQEKRPLSFQASTLPSHHSGLQRGVVILSVWECEFANY